MLPVKRMRARIVTTLLLLATSLVGAATMTLDDKDLTKRLIGTWMTDPAGTEPMVSTATYNPDGTGSELVRPRGEPESAAVRVTTRWSITNAVLHITSTASSDPQKIPVGIKLQDRIISISADKFVFEALDGYGESKGQRSTKLRKKNA
jgi:hypothetical protein